MRVSLDQAVETIAPVKTALDVTRSEALVGVWRVGRDETAKSALAHTASLAHCAIRRANVCLQTQSFATLAPAFALAMLAGTARRAPGRAPSSDTALSA